MEVSCDISEAFYPDGRICANETTARRNDLVDYSRDGSGARQEAIAGVIWRRLYVVISA